jgi:hypothetical protein
LLTPKNERKSSIETMRLSSKKKIIILVASIVLVVSLVSATFLLQTRSQTVSFSLKAGIIDQLGEELPNPLFVNNATTTLENHGFNVTYHNETIDVAFFKNLANYKYGIIIIRAHAALRDDNSTVDLFTSELYSSSAHREEQDNGLLVEGFLNYTQPPREYFAITPKFIESLQGSFPRSVVIAMGCNTLLPYLQGMAEAFHEKGAEAFIGWAGYVLDTNTDSETMKLLESLIVNNQTIGSAVHDRYDEDIGSSMAYYPKTAQNLKISDLVTSLSGASSLQFAALASSRGKRAILMK